MLHVHRPLACAALSLLAACSTKTPWVGKYELDVSEGMRLAVARMNRHAEERGMRPIVLGSDEQGVVLELCGDGTFRLERKTLGATIVTTGTYAVYDQDLTMRSIELDGQPMGEQKVESGKWTRAEVTLDGWGTLRRIG